MRQSSPEAAGLCGALPAALPVYIAPHEDEALYSWIARLAARLGLTPLDAARYAFGIDGHRRGDWWRRPSPAAFATLAAKTGIDGHCLRSMTLSGWAQARCDERHGRFSASGFWRQRAKEPPVRPLAICCACLAGSEQRFVRTEWMIGWIAVCAKHRTILTSRCPACREAVSLPGLHTRKEAEIGRCSRCSAMLGGWSEAPALHLVCEVQKRLLDLKRNGAGELDGIGLIAWETMVNLIDLVLAAIWRPKARFSRERFFDRVVRDIGLDPDERLQVGWLTNYGTMIVLGWLLERWPERMAVAMDLLRARELDALTALLREIGGEPDARLAILLSSLIPKSTAVEEEWRRWLETIPETADMLREQAWRELRRGAGKRLTVLANLLEGMDVPSAKRAGLPQAALKRWLDIGMAYGLEALRAEDTHINWLTPEQQHMIAAWLNGVSRLGRGPAAWTAEHAQLEVAIRFGVLLPTSDVIRLVERTRHAPAV